jgi:hypothetical protein
MEELQPITDTITGNLLAFCRCDLDISVHLLSMDRLVEEKVAVYAPFLSANQYFCNEILD